MVEKRKQIIEVVSYNCEWPIQFSNEAECVKNIFKDNFSDIYHIGSTAVPGMPAKPTIDILLEVKDISRVDSLNDEMMQFGYDAWGEYNIPGRRFFVKGENKRTYHIHTFQSGSREIMRHLWFRDYLIAHPDAATEYANFKIDLARKFAHNRRAYVMGKQDFVAALEEKAVAWVSRQD